MYHWVKKNKKNSRPFGIHIVPMQDVSIEQHLTDKGYILLGCANIVHVDK